MSRAPALLIGVGNRARADDGVGPAVVDEVRRRTSADGAPPVDTIVREGDLADLPLCWEGYDDVTIVDACRTGGPLGSVVPIDPAHAAGGDPCSTHGIGVAESVGLAARLGRLPAELRVVGVEGVDFGWGPMSPALSAAVPDVTDRVLAAIAGRASASAQGA